MQTDLRKILAVSGRHGLYSYVAQSRGGVIAECLADKKRTVFGGSSRITTLADIAIYTSEGELKIAEVFSAIKNTLGEGTSPLSSKAPDSEIKALFDKAVPNYDADRFYLSHMKKILGWYGDLVNYASLDFVTEEDDKQKED